MCNIVWPFYTHIKFILITCQLLKPPFNNLIFFISMGNSVRDLHGGPGVSLGCSDPGYCFVRFPYPTYTMYLSNSHFLCNFSCPAGLHFLFSGHNNLTFTCHAYKELSCLDPNETQLHV